MATSVEDHGSCELPSPQALWLELCPTGASNCSLASTVSSPWLAWLMYRIRSRIAFRPSILYTNCPYTDPSRQHPILGVIVLLEASILDPFCLYCGTQSFMKVDSPCVPHWQYNVDRIVQGSKCLCMYHYRSSNGKSSAMSAPSTCTAKPFSALS